MAKRIEEHLYRTAKSKEEYLDARTLKKRLQNVATDLDLGRLPSGGQSTKSSSQMQSIQSKLQQETVPSNCMMKIV